MISGLFVLCAVFAAANAGGLLEYGSGLHSAPIVTESRAALPLAAAAYSAAPLVSTSYSSIAAPGAAYAAPIARTLAVPEYAATQQNIVRSFDGTVSHYSKGIDTPFSSVRKIDSRISNNVYSPAIATKTLAVAAPGLATYAAPALATSYAAPAVATSYAAPAAYTTSYAAPTAYAAHASYAAPAAYASHASYAAPAAYASHASYAAPAVAYSPAATVAHVSYEGLGAKYAW